MYAPLIKDLTSDKMQAMKRIMPTQRGKFCYGSLGSKYPKMDGTQKFVREQSTGDLHCRIVASPCWVTYVRIARDREEMVLSLKSDLEIVLI